MENFKFADVIVEGKRIADYVKSDEGLVDYSIDEFLVNVSSSDEFIIYDLGEYLHDSRVGKTTYYEGLDLARVTACAQFHTTYHKMSFVTAMEGDDYTRVFFQSFRKPTIEDYIFYYFHLLDGDLYISNHNYHVYVKGRIGTEEERKETLDCLAQKCYRQ